MRNAIVRSFVTYTGVYLQQTIECLNARAAEENIFHSMYIYTFGIPKGNHHHQKFTYIHRIIMYITFCFTCFREAAALVKAKFSCIRAPPPSLFRLLSIRCRVAHHQPPQTHTHTHVAMHIWATRLSVRTRETLLLYIWVVCFVRYIKE